MSKKNKTDKKSSSVFFKTILPFGGLIITILFALGSVFFGFMNLKIDCIRPNTETSPTCEIDESRFFGLYSRSTTVQNVSDIGYKNSVGNKNMLQSTLVLKSENSEVPISEVSMNLGSWKEDVSKKTKSYLNNNSEISFNLHYFNWNIFGILGIAMLLILMMSILYYLKNVGLNRASPKV